MTRQRIHLLGFGIVVSAIFLYLALRGMDWSALGQTLRDVKIGDVAVCMVMVSLGIVLRGWRWCLISGRSWQLMLTFIRATNLGLLGNFLLPARLGEVVRVVVLKRTLKAGLSESVGSALIDRIFDVVVLLLSAWLVSTLVARVLLPQGWIFVLLGALAAFVTGLLVIRSDRFHDWLRTWSERYLHRWSLRPDSFARIFQAQVEALVNWHNAGAVLFVVLLVWLVDYLTVFVALRSVGLDLPLLAPLLLWVMLGVGSALPSAPGYVGVYQLAAVLALATYNVPPHQAIAVSLIIQGAGFFVSLLSAGGEVGRLWAVFSRYDKDNEG